MYRETDNIHRYTKRKRQINTQIYTETQIYKEKHTYIHIADKERKDKLCVVVCVYGVCVCMSVHMYVYGNTCTHLLNTAVSVLASTVRLSVSFMEPLVTVSVTRSTAASSSTSQPLD